MKKLLKNIGVLALLSPLLIAQLSFSDECVKQVKRVQVSKSADLLWIQFTDNTTAYAYTGEGDNSEGIDRVFSIALSAKITKKNVILHVNSGVSCNTNFQRNWEYLSLEE